MELSNFAKRAITSSVIAVLFAVLFLLRFYVPAVGIYLFDVLFLTLMALGLYELASPMKLNLRGAQEYVALIVISMMYFFYIIGTVIMVVPFEWWLIAIIWTAVIFVFAAYIFLFNMTDKAFAKRCQLEKKDCSKECLLGAVDFIKMLLYPGIGIWSLIIINHLDGYIGFIGLLLVFCITFATDTFSYCTGLLLGKGTAKLAPTISPKKTWIGLVGGLFAAVITALLILLVISANGEIRNYLTEKLTNVTNANLVFSAIGILGCLVSAAGDLFESWLKRKANVKDFANYLPGHGSIMDRIDSIIFNAVFILIIMEIIVLI
jgi:CDP-diglyceride synthetase